MIKATQFDRSTGKVIALVTGRTLEKLQAAYVTDQFDIREGHEELPAERPVEARVTRNCLLDGCMWTILPDSPLTSECQSEWHAYRAALHALLKDDPDQSSLVWPEPPALVYTPLEE